MAKHTIKSSQPNSPYRLRCSITKGRRVYFDRLDGSDPDRDLLIIETTEEELMAMVQWVVETLEELDD